MLIRSTCCGNSIQHAAHCAAGTTAAPAGPRRLSSGGQQRHCQRAAVLQLYFMCPSSGCAAIENAPDYSRVSAGDLWPRSLLDPANLVVAGDRHISSRSQRDCDHTRDKAMLPILLSVSALFVLRNINEDWPVRLRTRRILNWNRIRPVFVTRLQCHVLYRHTTKPTLFCSTSLCW